MKNLKAKAVCVMLSASMAAMGLTGCGSDNVDGTKTAITVNVRQGRRRWKDYRGNVQGAVS